MLTNNNCQRDWTSQVHPPWQGYLKPIHHMQTPPAFYLSSYSSLASFFCISVCLVFKSKIHCISCWVNKRNAHRDFTWPITKPDRKQLISKSYFILADEHKCWQYFLSTSDGWHFHQTWQQILCLPSLSQQRKTCFVNPLVLLGKDRKYNQRFSRPH